jgi:hypothetical protein
MSGAKGGEENIAAAAATVQQARIALGAAIAGLVANASGLDDDLDPGSVLRASLGFPWRWSRHLWRLCDRRAMFAATVFCDRHFRAVNVICHYLT